MWVGECLPDMVKEAWLLERVRMQELIMLLDVGLAACGTQGFQHSHADSLLLAWQRTSMRTLFWSHAHVAAACMAVNTTATCMYMLLCHVNAALSLLLARANHFASMAASMAACACHCCLQANIPSARQHVRGKQHANMAAACMTFMLACQ